MRSDGVLPAPDTPDFASTMMSLAGASRPAGEKRREREQRRRRIAARIGHEPRALDGRPLELGEAVREALGHPVRFRIPARAHGLVAQPEGAGQIDDADAGVDQRRRQLRGRLVGQREKHDVGLARERVGIERRDGAVPDVRERRQPARGRGADDVRGRDG